MGAYYNREMMFGKKDDTAPSVGVLQNRCLVSVRGVCGVNAVTVHGDPIVLKRGLEHLQQYGGLDFQ